MTYKRKPLEFGAWIFLRVGKKVRTLLEQVKHCSLSAPQRVAWNAEAFRIALESRL
jgi:hypothetical protein